MKRCPAGKRRVGRVCKRKPKARVKKAKARKKNRGKGARGLTRAQHNYLRVSAEYERANNAEGAAWARRYGGYEFEPEIRLEGYGRRR